jgi:hypothetical protein
MYAVIVMMMMMIAVMMMVKQNNNNNANLDACCSFHWIFEGSEFVNLTWYINAHFNG